jgi:hypothetical protein
LVAGAVALTGLAVVGPIRSASASPLCEVFPERCPLLQTISFDPHGAIDAPSFSSSSVRVTGWAGDPEAAGPIDVIVTVDGAVVGRATANLLRSANGYRGFDVTLPRHPPRPRCASRASTSIAGATPASGALCSRTART